MKKFTAYVWDTAGKYEIEMQGDAESIVEAAKRAELHVAEVNKTNPGNWFLVSICDSRFFSTDCLARVAFEGVKHPDQLLQKAG